MTITKVLIANRGEIAVRIARTCREMGIATVAVFSDPDADALHVRSCDEAVRLGGATPVESYLDRDKVMDAALRTRADAVHPGYGFLAENAAFAERVVADGLTWIGPPAQAIAAMGDKIAAKQHMREAGVPLLSSTTIDEETDLDDISTEIGFPLIVKAAAGGGGKGMRVVHHRDDLAAAIAGAGREAEGAFGDGRVFVERYVERPRHVEIQILGDQHGNLVHLFERECSIQRRHQKVVEESPSPVLSGDVRERMGAAAVAAGEAIGYTNAGTVEFIVEERDDGLRFSFLEVNTRLQVEHPVTELVTGLDLVRLQLLVAMDEPLPFAQEDLRQEGHAIEVRLYAEDPANDYLPATGRLHAFAPGLIDGVRWDTGVEAGSEVSTYYDPMLAKVVAHAGTRHEAAGRLARALETTVLHGVTTNRDLLVRVLRDEAFLDGDTTTDFLAERFPDEAVEPGPDPALVRQAVLADCLLGQAERARARRVLTGVPSGFTNDPHARWQTTYRVVGEPVVVAYRMRRDGATDLEVHGDRAVGRVRDDATVELDGHVVPVRRSVAGDERHLVLPSGAVTLVEVPRFPERHASDIPGATLAPMPGAVVEVAVAEGDTVVKGQLLVVLEAMKMEHRITAPLDGVVASVAVAGGQQVDADAVLVVVEEPPSDEG